MNSMSKILSVEGIRGWACLLVLLSHLSLTFYPYLHGFIGDANPLLHPFQYILHESPFCFFISGTSAVYIFFVLSGYILTCVSLKPNGSPERLISMSIKRYPRLMLPSLISCLIALFLIENFTHYNHLLNNWIYTTDDTDHFSIFDSLYSGAVDAFFISGSSIYNPVLWTMKIELIGSFIIYILCTNRLFFKCEDVIPILVFILFSLVIFKVIKINMGLGFISFICGYFIYIHGRVLSTNFAIFLILLGGYLAGAHNTSWSYAFLYKLIGKYTYEFCNFISGFVIVYAILFNVKLSNLFSGAFSIKLGKVSFSMYLIHLPVFSTVGVYVFELIVYYTGMYDVAAFASSLFSIIITYILSCYFYKYVDLNAIAFSVYFSKHIVTSFRFITKK